MIKVLDRKEVPTGIVNCNNCHSKLEYTNADLDEVYDSSSSSALNNKAKNYCFGCPVCGCIVIANWIL